MIGFGVGLGAWRRRGGGGGPSYDPDALALFTRMDVQPSTARKDLINDVIVAMKATNVWTIPDGLHVKAAHTAQAARLNWKGDIYNLTEVNSPTFEVDHFYAGNGSSSRLATGFNPSTAVDPNFVQNSAHLMFFSRTGVNDGAGSHLDIGGTTAVLSAKSTNGPAIRGNLNDAGSTGNLGAITDAIGMTVITRGSSSLVESYRDGVAVGSRSVASTPVDNVEFTILAAVGRGGYSARQCVASSYGGHLTAQNVADMYAALLPYLRAIGAVLYPSPYVSALTLPDIPGYSAVGAAFTCTGLAVRENGDFVIGDDGRYGTELGSYDGTNWRPKIHIVSPAGALVTSIDVYAVDGSASSLQGVAVDAAGAIWAARLSRNRIMRFSAAGAFVDEFTAAPTGGPNGLAYDSLRDRMLVSGISDVDTIRRYTQGGVEGTPITVTGTGTDTIDQMTYDAGRDWIWLTKGINGTVGQVFAIDAETGEHRRSYRLSNATAIEGIILDGDDLVIANDGGFHGGGTNALQRYDITV